MTNFNQEPVIASNNWRSAAVLTSAICFAAAGLTPSAVSAEETRGYVVSWFAQATHSQDGDCSRGVHPALEDVYFQYLDGLGIDSETIKEIKQSYLEGRKDERLIPLMMERARLNGEPANPWTYPASTADLNLPGVDGEFAYGFDLDGKNSGEFKGFTDPETYEEGIDHALYEALGCARAFRGTLDIRPTYWAWSWGQLASSQPAWLITVSGEDLSQDGPVTITFDRALEAVRVNGDGGPRADMAYRADPDPRSHNVFKGELKEGIVTMAEKGDLRLLQNPLVAPELMLRNFQLRLDISQDDSARAIIGGYQPWEDIYWGFGNLSTGGEQQVIGDAVQLYHLMKRYADADPDPISGQNMSISAAYYIEAVPAFVGYPSASEGTFTAAQNTN